MARGRLTLLSVADAQERLIALTPELAIETPRLIDAAGRWAAQDVLALRSQPSAALSAMDGYAIRFADLPGPWRVVGESAAGQGLDREVGLGEAARIFTGAPLPKGSDTILIQENARRDHEALYLIDNGPSHEGLFVRRQGSDFTAGEPLVAAGDRLTPPRIALCAIGGHGALPCRRRARVALISTGDELVEAGAPVAGARLPSSNAPMLAALLGGLPVEVVDLGIVRDELPLLVAAFARAAEGADIVVTTGGASVGDHDLVRPALAAGGASLDFWRVAMKPGKPLMAGRLDGATVIGLPGNPVSAYVTAVLFLLPLIRRAMGARNPYPSLRAATLTKALPPGGDRAEYLRAQRSGNEVWALPNQDSAALRTLAAADALIVRAAQAPAAAAGEQVEIIDLA